VTSEHPLKRPLFAERRTWFGDTVLVVFLGVQILDGTLTYLGVHLFAISEGNPLIAFYMNRVGVGPSLTVAKLVASGCAVVLHVLTFHRLLAVLAALYVGFAILPWSLVLLLGHR